jgi:probable HAF family extracellular repeat protein
VTGYAATKVGGNASNHAFLYSGGSMIDLGTLGGNESFGFGINDFGQITGYSVIAGQPRIHAFYTALAA